MDLDELSKTSPCSPKGKRHLAILGQQILPRALKTHWRPAKECGDAGAGKTEPGDTRGRVVDRAKRHGTCLSAVCQDPFLGDPVTPSPWVCMCLV